MKSSRSLSRREFAAGSSGLVIGFFLPPIGALGQNRGPRQKRSASDVNAFVRIDTDGIVTLIVGKSEMGQGVYTGYAQLIGEELEVDWRNIRVQSAPVAAVYNSPVAPYQFTGSSDSTLTGFIAMRQAGATARLLLIAAGAEAVHVPATELHAERGDVVHQPSGRRLGFGQLAARAAQLPAPADVTLKAPSAWRLIGQPLPRVDSREKSNGSAMFGLDVRLPHLHYALIARAPRYGATLISFDPRPANAIPDVLSVVRVPSGIAVIATNSWAARRGRDALKVEWSDGAATEFSSARLASDYAALSRTPGITAFTAGDVAATPTGAPSIEAEYATPYLAHACMEPLNCTVAFGADGCHIYTGTQGQSPDRDAAAEAAGLPPDKIHVHTMLLGGGFGRRGHPHSDFVCEAVAVAKTYSKPIMTLWSREDDLRCDYFRPQAHNRLTATLGVDGLPTTWTHTQVVQPLYVGTALEASSVDPKTGLDSSTHDGASDIPYAIPNIRMTVHQQTQPVPVMWMRSVGHSVTAFAIECFIDECAHAARKDPLEYRLALLKDKPRHLAVLQLAAAKAGWGTPLQVGRARGIAVHQMTGTTTVAQVAEVSVVNGRPQVHRVVVAVDCGTVVNPRSVAQQMEGAVNFGLSAALYAEITLEDGRVQQSNFDDYQIVRFNDAPTIETYIVPSTEPPSGVGQEAVPPIAPAVANALFSLTGIRARRLPLKHTTFVA